MMLIGAVIWVGACVFAFSPHYYGKVAAIIVHAYHQERARLKKDDDDKKAGEWKKNNDRPRPSGH